MVINRTYEVPAQHNYINFPLIRLCNIQTIIKRYNIFIGLLYMCVKHVVDRHNIYYGARPSKMSPEPHQRAVNFVHTGAVLLQLNIVAFTMLRTRKANFIGSNTSR